MVGLKRTVRAIAVPPLISLYAVFIIAGISTGAVRQVEVYRTPLVYVNGVNIRMGGLNLPVGQRHGGFKPRLVMTERTHRGLGQPKVLHHVKPLGRLMLDFRELRRRIIMEFHLINTDVITSICERDAHIRIFCTVRIQTDCGTIVAET